MLLNFKLLITASFLIVLSSCVLAQNSSDIDSLRTKLNKLSKNDKLQESILRNQLLEFEIHTESKDFLLKTIDTLAQLYQTLKDTIRYNEVAYQKRGLVHQLKGDLLDVLPFYQKFAEAIQELPLAQQNGYFYIDIGRIYSSLHMFESAKRYYEKSMQVFQVQDQADGLSTSLGCLSLTFHNQNQLDSSAHYARLAFDTRTKGTRDKFTIAYQHFLLGLVLVKTLDVAAAKNEFLTALKLLHDPSFKDSESYGELKIFAYEIPNALVGVYLKESNFDSANYYVKMAKAATQQYDLDPSNEFHCNRTFLKVLAAEGKYKEAIDLGNDLLKQLGEDLENGALSYKRLIIKDMIAIYEKTGNKAKMYEYVYLEVQIAKRLDSNKDKDKMVAINSLVLEMENNQKIKNQELILTTKEKEASAAQLVQQRLIFGLVALSLFLVLLLGMWFLVRKKNIEINRYSAELEKSNSTKEMLISIVSHDLRSPFHTIMSTAQLASQDPTQTDMQRINQMARNAFLMLDNLMQWVSLQKENLKPTIQSINLVDMVGELKINFQQTALLHQTTIELDFAMEWVLTDSTMLTIMLRNILGNAIKNSPPNGRVLISTQLVNQVCILKIKDEGAGFPQEIIDQFSNKGNYAKVAKEGGGLGLQLVRDFSQQLLIPVQLYNAPTGGAIFELTLKPDAAKLTEQATVNNTQIDVPAQQELSDADKKTIQPILLQLQQYDIFETTELYLVLDQLTDTDNVRIQHWLTKVRMAIYQNNLEQFNLLITQAN